MAPQILVVAPFLSLDAPSRPRAVASALSQLGTVTILMSDFDHVAKVRRTLPSSLGRMRITSIRTLPYGNNRGVRRFVSHLLFGLAAIWFFARKRSRFDGVYVTLPLNLAACGVLLLANRHRTVADIIDFWPDVLPFPNIVRRSAAPFFALWRSLFAFACHKADLVLSVSDSFRVSGQRHRRPDAPPVKRIYIGHAALPPVPREIDARRAQRVIAYVGNLGHLYDFSALLAALAMEDTRKSHQLAIVGDGDRRNWLLSELRRLDIAHVYHGVVYNTHALSQILSAADWGFNGYVNTTASFSYKAGTYLSAGLPLLNCMTGDIAELVNREHLGVNYREGDGGSLARVLMQTTDLMLRDYRTCCTAFFERELEARHVETQLLDYLRANATFEDHE